MDLFKRIGNLFVRGAGTPLAEYELGATLGDGGYGVVYQATHRETGQQFALKKNPINGRQDLEDLFNEEGRIMESLAGHANIVRCFGYFHAEDAVWIK